MAFTLKDTTAREVHTVPIIDLIAIFPFLYFVHLIVIATKDLHNHNNSNELEMIVNKTGNDKYSVVCYIESFVIQD